MTRYLFVCCIAVVAAVSFPHTVARSQGASEEQVEAARAMVRAGARQIVREELELSEEEARDFWPLYDKYRAELLEVEDAHIDLLRDFLQKYYGYSLTDVDAKEYLDSYFDIQKDVLDIRRKYVRRFRRILGSIEVMRLYQIENKIRAEIDAALAITVPLADPN